MQLRSTAQIVAISKTEKFKKNKEPFYQLSFEQNGELWQMLCEPDVFNAVERFKPYTVEILYVSGTYNGSVNEYHKITQVMPVGRETVKQ